MSQTYVMYTLLDPHDPAGEMSDDTPSGTSGMYKSLGHQDAAGNHVD